MREATAPTRTDTVHFDAPLLNQLHRFANFAIWRIERGGKITWWRSDAFESTLPDSLVNWLADLQPQTLPPQPPLHSVFSPHNEASILAYWKHIPVEIWSYKTDDHALQGMMINLLKQRQTETKLKVLAELFQTAPVGILLADPQYECLHANDRFSDLIGQDRLSLMGSALFGLLAGKDEKKLSPIIRQAVDNKKHWSGRVWFSHRTGKAFPSIARFSRLEADTGYCLGYLLVVEDLTDSHNKTLALNQMAYVDHETRLPNEKRLTMQLEECLKHAPSSVQIALLHIRLDQFELLLDGLSNKEVGQLLRATAKRLKDNIGEHDLLARVSRSGFAVALTENTSITAISDKASALLEVFKQAVKSDTHQFYVSITVGASIYGVDAFTAEQLIEHGHEAVVGCNTSEYRHFNFYNSKIRQVSSAQLVATNELRHALNQGNFSVLFQPVICCRTGRVRQLDCCLSLHSHPVLKAYNTLELVLLAEQSGFVDLLDIQVMRRAIKEFEQISRDYPHELQLSVNRSMAYSGKVDLLLEALEACHIPPHRLIVELCERNLEEDDKAQMDTICQLQQNKIKVALDNYGSSRISMVSVLQKSYDYLRLDSRLVDVLAKNHNTHLVLEGLIKASHLMGREVIADGLEDIDQANLLHALGCDYLQGYSLSKPLDREPMTAFLQKNYHEPMFEGHYCSLERVAQDVMQPAACFDADERLETVFNHMKDKAIELVIVAENKATTGFIDRELLFQHISPFVDTDAETSHDRATINKRLHQVCQRHFVTVSLDTPLSSIKHRFSDPASRYLLVQNVRGQCLGYLAPHMLL